MSEKDLEAQWQEECSNAGCTDQTSPEDPAQTGEISDESSTVVENCPQGNPRLAAFLDCDENFMMYRRFGWIQARLLLRKQREISDMEKNLEVQDGFPRDGGATDAHEKTSEYKEELLDEVEAKFLEYSDIDSEQDGWVQHKEDIVTLRPGREHAWLDMVLEKLLQTFRPKFIRTIFCSQVRDLNPLRIALKWTNGNQETRMKTNGPLIHLYTRSRIEALAAAVITVTILILLVIPTYVLYHLTSDVTQGSRTSALSIGVLLIFTLAFSAVLSLFTRARRHEILAAAAA
ncbi:hypothetical protein SLS58_009160 [Diplodia intermedia]|uniref:DUF6594 domain-containing protein n=1 Tax=Diplodia intermedia TaxID=856260 RepID=A0ABR3TDW6_9PEZI